MPAKVRPRTESKPAARITKKTRRGNGKLFIEGGRVGLRTLELVCHLQDVGVIDDPCLFNCLLPAGAYRVVLLLR